MDKYLDFLQQKGVILAKEISPSSVITAPWTIFKCQFGCKSYNHSNCCPPRAPSFKQTREILDSYEKAILFCTHGYDATDIAVEMERLLFLDGFYKAISFGSGPCHICKNCSLDSCRFPEKTTPAMEACGIDVFATARNNGFTISVLQEKNEIHHHFGLVLIY